MKRGRNRPYQCTINKNGIGDPSSKYAYDRKGEQFEADIQRHIDKGEQLLQYSTTTEPIQAVAPKPKKTYVTLYIIMVWDAGGMQMYTTKDSKRYIAFLKEITAQGKAYKVERVKTVTYK